MVCNLDLMTRWRFPTQDEFDKAFIGSLSNLSTKLLLTFPIDRQAFPSETADVKRGFNKHC